MEQGGQSSLELSYCIAEFAKSVTLVRGDGEFQAHRLKMRPVKRKNEVLPASKVSKVKKADDEPPIKASKAKPDKLPAKAFKAKNAVNDIPSKDTSFLFSQMEILVKENEALKELNRRKDERIIDLENTLELIKEKGKSSQSVTVQTKDLKRMWCIECEYPAEDLYDLGEHMYEFHAEENDEYTISCYYCGNYFESKEDLMIHRKKVI